MDKEKIKTLEKVMERIRLDISFLESCYEDKEECGQIERDIILGYLIRTRTKIYDFIYNQVHSRDI